MSDKRKSIDIIVPIKETTQDSSYRVKIDDALLKEITEGDEHPQFVIVDFEECTSGNNITYDRPFFENLAKQVNEKLPTGYLGHKHTQGLDKEDLLPDPQVVWLGATISEQAGKAMLSTKGYLLPPEEGGKARAWIKRKAINSASWTGDAVLGLGKDGKYRVKEFILESIDFARKNREGIKNQRLRVVTEMEGEGIKVDEDDLKGAVGRLTFHELREYNPSLISVIKEMGKDEVKEETATAVAAKETELDAKHKKELEDNPDISMMQKIKSLLGIADDEHAKPDELISTILSRLDDIGTELVESWFRTEILEKKVTDEKARKLVARLIPIKEMTRAGDVRSDKGIEKIKQELEDKADDLIDNDEDVQTVLKEMASTRGGTRLGSQSRREDRGERGGNNGGNNNGGNNEDGFKENSNVRVERVRVG